MRFRLGLDGTLFGFIAVHWTLIALTLPARVVPAVKETCELIDGFEVRGAKFLSGKMFATVT